MNELTPEPRDNLDPFTSHFPLSEDPNVMLALIEQKYGAVYFLNKQWPLESAHLLLVRICGIVSPQMFLGSFHFKKTTLCHHVDQVTKLKETFCLVRLMFVSILNRNEVIANAIAKLDRECIKFLQETAFSVLDDMREETFPPLANL